MASMDSEWPLKIRNALHSEYTIFIKYFSSYIKKFIFGFLYCLCFVWVSIQAATR